MSQDPNELKPLSMFEKIKVGVKGFIKSAVDYIPSGLLYTGLMMGGSMAITALTGFDIAGIMPGGSLDVGALAMKSIGTIVLSSTVTGAIGAYKGVSSANEQRSAEMEWQRRGVEVSPRVRGQQRQQSSGMTSPVVATQRGLPQQQTNGQRTAPGF
jgi:hypothetical protein